MEIIRSFVQLEIIRKSIDSGTNSDSVRSNANAGPVIITFAKMTTNGLYGGGEKIPGISDVEYAADPASGGFFHSDYKK
mgnify:CR=1 FL=1